MNEPPATDRPTWSRTTKRVAKLALTAMVLFFVARQVLQARRDLLARGLTWGVDWHWLALAVGLYVLGLAALGVYFWRVLASSPTPVGFYPAVRAYLISHLAKYVPGKAMVVVVRSALVVPAGARPATAAFATLYETLAMMAAGGLLAAAGFASLRGADPPGPSVALPGLGDRSVSVEVVLAGVSLLAGIGFLVLVWPSVFPRLAGLIRRPLRGVGADALPRLGGLLLLEGLAWAALGWTLLGLSQVAVIAALTQVGSDEDIRFNIPPAGWPAVVASVALATVAGFAVPVAPGGLGVREWVLWTALGSTLDRDWAVVAALVLRMVWIGGEVGVAGVLYLIPPRARRVAG